MRRRPLLTLLATAILLGTTALLPIPTALGAEPADLAQRAEALIQRLAPPESHVGVSVIALGSGQVIYEREANKLFVPASLQKIATAGAALSILGGQKRFATRLVSEFAVENGVLKGTLYLKGEGDPTLELADLEALAATLRGQGVREIAGDLVADPSYFQPEGRGAAGWAWDDLSNGYGAPVSALSLHRNTISVSVEPAARAGEPLKLSVLPASSYILVHGRATTQAAGEQSALGMGLEKQAAGAWQEVLTVKGGLPVGAGQELESLSVADPPRFALVNLKEAMGREGITIGGQLRLGQAPPLARALAAHQSPPLADVVHEMLKESDNMIAETILLQLGVKVKGGPGTWEKGLSALRGYLERAGWAPDSYRLADGSGLSRYNAVSPAMLTRLLAYMPGQRQSYPAFLIALPLSGVDGTLAKRMTTAGVRGRLRAKTGSMSGISGMAGYLDTADGQTLVVAIMTNGFIGTAARCRTLQDALVEALAGP